MLVCMQLVVVSRGEDGELEVTRVNTRDQRHIM